MTSTYHRSDLHLCELLECSLDAFLETEESFIPHGVETLALEVILHDRKTPLDRVVLWRVRNIPDHCDLEFIDDVAHYKALVERSVVHEECERLTLTCHIQIFHELGEQFTIYCVVVGAKQLYA